MNLVRDWYFVQAGPLDPRAKTLPLPDALMGRLVEYVAAHEVGHTLGFQHNMKASSMYPAAKLRDREWLKTMGHTPTLMDYSRFNYVVQPEDGIDPEDLIPAHRPVRQVGDDVGLQADSRPPTRPTTRRARSTPGRASRTTRRTCGSPPPDRAAPIRASSPKRSATKTRSRRRRSGSRTWRAWPACCFRPRRHKPANRSTISRRSTDACSASGPWN